jgi:hypothetical protein
VNAFITVEASVISRHEVEAPMAFNQPAQRRAPTTEMTAA